MMSDIPSTGRMYFDDDRLKPLEEKLRQFAAMYLEKTGHRPVLCLVSVEQVVERAEIDGITILPARHIRPNNFQLTHEIDTD
jgi:hypothetical protein